MNDQQPGQAQPIAHALYVTLMLDETGSMQACKGAAIAGINQYLAALREEPAVTRLTMTLFNSRRTEVRHRGVPVSAVPDLDVETYRPGGNTPLYDAIGSTLHVARQEAPPGWKKLCVILTDGLENASRDYTRQQVFDLIKACEQEGWQFLYLGADHDVWAAGEELGIAEENRVPFRKDALKPTFDHLSEATSRLRRDEPPPDQGTRPKAG